MSDPVKVKAEPALATAAVGLDGSEDHRLQVSFKSVAGRCAGCRWSASSFDSVDALQEAHAQHLAETFPDSEA